MMVVSNTEWQADINWEDSSKYFTLQLAMVSVVYVYVCVCVCVCVCDHAVPLLVCIVYIKEWVQNGSICFVYLIALGTILLSSVDINM